MKKILIFMLVFVCLFSINVSATEKESVVETVGNSVYEYLDDGSYIVTTLEYVETNDVFQSDSQASDDYTVTGRKSATCYDGDDELVWQVTVTGVFLIVPSNTAQSGYCQSSTLTYTIKDSAWHIYNIVEQEITNNAYVSCTMKRKFLGITTKTVDVELYITCDKFGNLS